MSSTKERFKTLRLPSGVEAKVPADLDLRLPETASVDRSLLQRLIFIPWDDKYLARVPADYRRFFDAVLPYLHVRTTDVHVATCLPFAAELIRQDPVKVDARVVHLAFILHDTGWSQMSEEEIADSLGVEGSALSGAAVGPKERHVELGRAVAERVLKEHPPEPPVTDDQREMIFQAILYHDKPAKLAAMGELPASVRVVCDVDHLWSFTRENFWQDTVRKGVDPTAYVKNLGEDLEGYFVAEPGRNKARQMLEQRRLEVEAWEE